VSFEVSRGVATITMDHPENRNALTPTLIGEVAGGLAQAVADRTVRVVVLTHSGPAFCAGADLKAPASSGVPEGLVELLEAILDAPKPVVCRIAGPCLAGGVGLAAACDLSIASDDASFGFTEVRLGLAPAIVSVVCLPKLRASDARELFLTGQRISAERAERAGLINRAVPAADLDAAVGSVIDQLCAGAPDALAAAKRLVAMPSSMRAEAFAAARDLSARLFAGEEAAAGIAAFRSRQPAPWVPA
jgi:methylglutaconyl-CoA hydratase